MTEPILQDSDPRLEAVQAALAGGDLARAAALAEQALAAGQLHPGLLNLRAFKAEHEGRLTDALADLNQARALAPEDVSVLNALGLCLTRLDRTGEAVEALAEATRLAPDFAQAWNNKGVAELAHGAVGSARESFEAASRLQPGFAEPRGHLALLAARRGEHDEARRLAQAALASKPRLSEAVRALGEVDLAEGRPQAAEQRLRALLGDPTLGPNGRYLSGVLLGDALDRQGRYADAFEAYQAANSLQRRANAARFGAGGLPDLLEGLLEAFEAFWPRGAPAGEGEPSPAGQHVFLIGFMRSGTTLMEQVLAAQPDAVSLEEKEVLDSGVLEYLRRPEGMRRLIAADEAELSAHRADYWRRVRQWGVDPTGKLFIDKMPFDGLRLPLIHRLFPQAKVILAIRDPRDVVFSCFRSRFAVNAYSYELLALPSAVRLYDLYMRSVRAFSARLPLSLHRYRHEDLVADFDGQVRALCDFLGVEWSADMRDVGRRAREGRVISPSAPQLLGGLSRAGLQQWRRYETQLAPYFGPLAPWVREFGYE